MKQSNVFDYYATGGSSKIADFAKSRAAITSSPSPKAANVLSGINGNNTAFTPGAIAATAAAGTPGPTPSSGPKRDNTWVWVLAIGAVALGGYLLHRYFKNKEEEEAKNRKRN